MDHDSLYCFVFFYYIPSFQWSSHLEIKWYFFWICATWKIKVPENILLSSSSDRFLLKYLECDVLEAPCTLPVICPFYTPCSDTFLVKTHGHELSNGHLTNANRSTHQWLFNSSIVLHICVCVFVQYVPMYAGVLHSVWPSQAVFFFLCMCGYGVCKPLYFHKTMHPRMWISCERMCAILTFFCCLHELYI